MVGDNAFIHQSITGTTCFYKKFFCQPSEFSNFHIVWKPSNHNFNHFRSLGLFHVQQLADFVLIPKLKFGRTIQNEQGKGLLLQLDNGFLIIKCNTHTFDSFKPFLQNATEYLSKAHPSLQTGLLEVHLMLILENQQQNMISLWEQFCNDDNLLLKIER